MALLLKCTLLRGETQAFLMELPTYKWPSPRTVIYRVYEQGREFVVSAGTIIFAVAVIVWALGYYPRPLSIATQHETMRVEARTVHEDNAHAKTLPERLAEIDRLESGTYLRQSLLGRMGRWVEPVVEPLGWDWRIGTAAIASFPAREVVIATMGTIYNLGDDQDQESAGLRKQLHRATWPDGRPVFNLAVALSVMVFFALCCQCGATLAVIRRETSSWRWPLFTFTYMTTLAYVGALITYQVSIRLIS
jgi:ferrous iron transport protein B